MAPGIVKAVVVPVAFALPRGAPRRAAIASVLAAMAAAVLDASSVNMALPSIAGALQVHPSIAAWLVIAYQGALVASLLPLAAMGERFGHRRTFVVGTALFGFCAAASGSASGFATLVAFRALQGVGAAAIMALGVALLRQSVAEDELGKAIGWNAMTVALMSAAGPAIGAVLLGLGSWRFVFLGSGALAAMALVASRSLPTRGGERRALDPVGLLLYLSIAPAFVVAVGLARIWASLSGLLVAGGVAGLLLLLQRDLRRASPFLPLALLRAPDFRRSVLASVACFTAISMALIMLPFGLHGRLGLSPPEVALMMTPWPLAVLLTTPVTARLLDHHLPQRLCSIGGTLLAFGLVLLALGSQIAGVPVHVVGVILCGIGFGLFQTPNNRTMFLAAPIDRAASVGGIQGTARLTGQVTGALIASILLAVPSVGTGASLAFGIAAVAAIASAAVSGMNR